MFSIAFILLFTFGGFTGVILANAAIDLALHDSYYVVAQYNIALSELLPFIPLVPNVAHFDNS
jgi:heme/copper-type cytochrome/quinol oxidase subunit 1